MDLAGEACDLAAMHQRELVGDCKLSPSPKRREQALHDSDG